MTGKAGKVLALEPYYGGSHKAFLDGLAKVLPAGLDLISLPARKWKWRMRLSAPWFAENLEPLDPTEYSCLLCSTFVDVAALKGLAPEGFSELPVCIYFHENQFAYPVREEMERDFHFALTNVTTALASDRIAFNSSYNLESFLDGCRALLKKSYDMKLSDFQDSVREKASVIFPGQNFSAIDLAARRVTHEVPVIIWNHRWEHDKNPEEFFAALFELVERQVDFRLVVLGESFRDQPEIFREAQERLGERIIRFGFAESLGDYIYWLRQGDIVVSTATHEFFGISVIEAVRAGCRPLLPDRLSYPELFPGEYLYRDGELASKLVAALNKRRLTGEESVALTEHFSWHKLEGQYRDWLEF